MLASKLKLLCNEGFVLRKLSKVLVSYCGTGLVEQGVVNQPAKGQDEFGLHVGIWEQSQQLVSTKRISNSSVWSTVKDIPTVQALERSFRTAASGLTYNVVPYALERFIHNESNSLVSGTQPTSTKQADGARLSTDRVPQVVSTSGCKEPPNNGGWTYEEVVNLPNGISMARMISGPAIAAAIVGGHWPIAVGGLVVAAASDYLDGFVAKHYQRASVLGSYLDPLADKVLVGCVVGALGYQGALSPPLVCVILARDAFLVVGAFLHRASMLKWRWPGLANFFKLSTPVSGSKEEGVPAAPFVRPLLISKANTVLQLCLVGGAMTHAWLGLPLAQHLVFLGGATAVTTVASCAAYIHVYRKGSLFR